MVYIHNISMANTHNIVNIFFFLCPVAVRVVLPVFTGTHVNSWAVVYSTGNRKGDILSKGCNKQEVM